MCTCCLLSSCCACTWETPPPSSTALHKKVKNALKSRPIIFWYNLLFPRAGWAYPAHWASTHAPVLQPPTTLKATKSLGNWGLEGISPSLPYILSIEGLSNVLILTIIQWQKFRTLEAASGNRPFLSLREFTVFLKSYPEVWIYTSNPPRHMAALRNVQDRKMCMKYQHIHGTCLRLRTVWNSFCIPWRVELISGGC